MKKILFFLALVVSVSFLTACDDDNEYLLGDPESITPKIEVPAGSMLIQTEQGAEIEIKADLANPSGLESVHIACTALGMDDLIVIDGKTYALAKKYTVPANVQKGMYFVTVTLNSANKLTVSSDIKVMVGMKDTEKPAVLLHTDLTATYPAEFDFEATLSDNIGLAKVELICEAETSVNYTEELSGVSRFDFVRKIQLPYSFPSKQVVLQLRLTDLAGLVTEESFTVKVNVYPNTLYIVGDASDAGWTTKDGIALTKVSDGVFAGIVKLKATGGWKFIANNGVDTWNPAWGIGDASDATGGQLNGDGGAGNIPAPAEEGFYTVTADFTTMTYKVEKLEALEKIGNLYLVGNMNGWDNADKGFMAYRDDNELTNGVYTYTGFFKKQDGGEGCYFKFCPEEYLGSWDHMYYAGADGELKNGNGDPAFFVPVEGYYTVTIDLLNMTWTLEALTETPTEYTKIGLMGAYNSWDVAREAFMTQSAYDKHMWTTELELPAGEIKFRADSNWDIAWGNGPVPYGKGDMTPATPNINIPEAGTYQIRFNDITGHYVFLKK